MIALDWMQHRAHVQGMSTCLSHNWETVGQKSLSPYTQIFGDKGRATIIFYMALFLSKGRVTSASLAHAPHPQILIGSTNMLI